jgi:hypothetical protein
MLLKVLHNPHGQICVSILPTSVLPVKPAKFYHNSSPGKKAKVEHFPVTLAYAITDYKCQGKTFPYVIVDLKKPSCGVLPPPPHLFNFREPLLWMEYRLCVLLMSTN